MLLNLVWKVREPRLTSTIFPARPSGYLALSAAPSSAEPMPPSTYSKGPPVRSDRSGIFWPSAPPARWKGMSRSPTVKALCASELSTEATETTEE